MSLLNMMKGVRLPRAAAPTPPNTLEPPQRVVLPLRQHQGPACQPTVEPGQAVAVGQVVGSSEDFETASVHSSVSGTVEGLVDAYDPAGQPVKAVAVISDGQDRWDEESEGLTQVAGAEGVAKTRPSRLLRALRHAGLVKAGTLGLPLHVDLSPPMAPRSYMFMTGIPVVRQIDTLIIRAVDPDPPVAPNQACLAEPVAIAEVGIAALARIAGAGRVVLALPPKGGDELAEMAASHEWEVTRMDGSAYPSAVEQLLVHKITGRVVPTPYGQARDVGVALEPLVTALDVGRVLTEGRPVVERLFTVAGEVANPQTFRVRLGTPIKEVIQAAGGLPAEPGKVILGGPMMGYAHFDLDTPVTKETDGLLIQSAASVAAFIDQPCIHCGRCVAVCPVNLVPAELSKLCEFHQFEDAADRDLMHCIECGCCAYVCPARRPMVHLLRYGKSEVLAERMEQ